MQTYRTIVIWQQKLSAEISAAMAQKASELGNNDSLTIWEYDVDNQSVVTRFWETQEQAQQWIDFVSTYNPVSATIPV